MASAGGGRLTPRGRLYLAERVAAVWHIIRERVVPQRAGRRRQGHRAGQLNGPAKGWGVEGRPDASASHVNEYDPADCSEAAGATTAGVAPLLTRVLVAQMIPL